MLKRFYTIAIAVLCALPFCARVFAAADKDYCVGAYYYPWYTDEKFENGDLTRSHTLVYHLKPRLAPELGWYSQTHPEVISQHYKWAKYAGIDFFITSYWGKDSSSDKTISQFMFSNPDRGDIKLAVFFEPIITQANAAAEMDYLCDNYFKRPAYFRIDKKPVIFVYLTRTMSSQDLAAYTNIVRKTARDKGIGEVYIVGDEMFGRAGRFNAQRVKLLDAITNYDVYGHLGALGSAGQYVTNANLNEWKSENDLWKKKANGIGRDFIPTVSPGFNDKAVREGHEPKSRKLNTNTAEFGSLFAALLDKAKPSADRNMIMVTSWNEWYEDSQIEPTKTAPPTNIDDSITGQNFTAGLYYNGYGTLYLDILRDKTTLFPPSSSTAKTGTGFESLAGSAHDWSSR